MTAVKWIEGVREDGYDVYAYGLVWGQTKFGNWPGYKIPLDWVPEDAKAVTQTHNPTVMFKGQKRELLCTHGIGQGSGKDDILFLMTQKEKMKAMRWAAWIRMLGIKFVGIQEFEGEDPLVLFNDEYGSTRAIPLRSITTGKILSRYRGWA